MSAREDLVAYLRKKTRKTAQDQIDWEARRKKWLQHVSDLYKHIRSWLSPLESEGTVKFGMAETVIEERLLGRYEAMVLEIMVGKQRVAFWPVGTIIVGAEGRIDVRGQKDNATLVLVKGKWNILQKTPAPKLVPFTEDSFLNPGFARWKWHALARELLILARRKRLETFPVIVAGKTYG